MNLERFQNGISEVLFSSYGDSQFDAIRTFCGGMSGVKTGKLLNFAVSCTDKDELYFEIGVYTGYTMISAGIGQPRHIIGVDNSSEFGDMKGRLMKNLDIFCHPNYQFIPHDFRNIGLDVSNERKTGVLYIDGKHDYKEVKDSLNWANNGILADKSLVVLDDISVDGVSEAINEWVSENKDYKTVFYLKPKFSCNDGLWSHDISIGLGIAVIKYERSLN